MRRSLLVNMADVATQPANRPRRCRAAHRRRLRVRRAGHARRDARRASATACCRRYASRTAFTTARPVTFDRSPEQDAGDVATPATTRSRWCCSRRHAARARR
jgi:hypothetical protein